MKKIAVIGTGSAGILSVCHSLYFLKDFEVTSVYDPKIPAVGIGESSTPVFYAVLNEALQIGDHHKFVEAGYIDSTIKYSTLYRNWRKQEYANPLAGDHNTSKTGIHFNTHKFRDFSFERLRNIYKERFKELHGSVLGIENNPDDIVLDIDGVKTSFDYVIDCRGWTKDFEGYNLLNMPVNHALVHNTPECNKDWGYTLHQATEDGWMFGIPLANRTSYGYLFNDKITNVDDAKNNFSKTINVPIDELEKIEFKFKNYYVENVLNNRLLKNGNLAVFFEPQFANSMWLYDYVNRLFYDRIIENESEEVVNAKFRAKALEIHDFICYYYHGGSNYDTDFWKYAMSYSRDVLDKSVFFKELCNKFNYMKTNKCFIPTNTIFNAPTLLKIEKGMEYDYWSRETLV